MKSKLNYYIPALSGLLVALGMLIGARYNPPQNHPKFDSYSKFKEVLYYIKSSYVDTVNSNKLADVAIREMVNELDPHSSYLSSDELVQSNQDLEGNFEGIGIEFNVLNDTIIVVSVIPGGPSEKSGVKSGDKIIKIENKNVAGIKISNNDIIKKLRGKSKTQVYIQVLRNGNKELLDFTIVRDKIPLYSVDAYYMIDQKTGYIKINRFSAKTAEEFTKSINELKKQGLQNLILDITDNPGGYLNAAFNIADQFFSTKKIIVYTEGRARPKEVYYSSGKGIFKTGKLVVMINENSASASEILAGSIQDWDRGIILGRRSFGKGLVQEQITLSDRSAVRLTVARYYTPSGRCIQKPYNVNNKSSYYHDIFKRLEHGELTNLDSTSLPSSFRYRTGSGRSVYGGGGIMPDIFVPLDTSGNTNLLSILIRKGMINQYAIKFVDEHRTQMNKMYKDDDIYIRNYKIDPSVLRSLYNKVEKDKMKNIPDSEIKRTNEFLSVYLKALIARNLYNDNTFYKIYNNSRKDYLKAIEIINSNKFKELGIKSSI